MVISSVILKCICVRCDALSPSLFLFLSHGSYSRCKYVIKDERRTKKECETNEMNCKWHCTLASEPPESALENCEKEIGEWSESARSRQSAIAISVLQSRLIFHFPHHQCAIKLIQCACIVFRLLACVCFSTQTANGFNRRKRDEEKEEEAAAVE